MAKSKVVAVTLYPKDREIVAGVQSDYSCNRSQAVRMIIRDWGRVNALATEHHVTVRELGIIFSSFAKSGG
jgi:hypothetical protein